METREGGQKETDKPPSQVSVLQNTVSVFNHDESLTAARLQFNRFIIDI